MEQQILMIKEIKEDFRISHLMLSKVMGVTERQLNRYENGIAQVPEARMDKLKSFYEGTKRLYGGIIKGREVKSK